MRIGSTLVRRWVYCLRANKDYSRYCRAKTLGPGFSDIVEKLEQEFDHIAELYDDWGPLRQIDLKATSTSFKEWEKIRIPLFFPPSHKVTLVTDAKNYEYAPGQLLISVPLHATKQQTIDSITRYINYFYNAKDNDRLKLDISKRMVEPLPSPKYPLFGDVTKATKGRIDKAICAYSHETIRVGFKTSKLSQTDTVVAIMQDAKNPFKWAMTDSDKAAHARGTFKKSLFNGPKVKRLVKANHDFDALVINTIHGRFPDFS